MAFLEKTEGDLNHLKEKSSSSSLNYKIEIFSNYDISSENVNVFNIILEDIENKIEQRIKNKTSNQHNVNVGDANLIDENIKFGYKVLISTPLLDFLKNNSNNIQSFIKILKQDIYSMAKIQFNQKFEGNLITDLFNSIKKNEQFNPLILSFKERNIKDPDFIKNHIKDNLYDTTIFSEDKQLQLVQKRVIIDNKIKFIKCIDHDQYNSVLKLCGWDLSLISYNLSFKEISNQLKTKIKLTNIESTTFIDLLDLHYQSENKSIKFVKFYETHIKNTNLWAANEKGIVQGTDNLKRNKIITELSKLKQDLESVAKIFDTDQRFREINNQIKIKFKI